MAPAPTAKPPTLLESLVEPLFDVLPAPDYSTILSRLNKHKDVKRKLNIHHVVRLLHRIRTDRGRTFLFHVPHVKRGVPTADDSERFVAVLNKADGSFEVTEENRRHIEDGAISTVTTIASMGRNEAAALREVAKHATSRTLKTRLVDISDDLEYAAKKAVAVLIDLDAERAARGAA